jgi:two-component system, cell cycle response regulator DivK
MAGDRDRCLEAGCDAYEEKPVDFSRLLATLQSLLDRPPTP